MISTMKSLKFRNYLVPLVLSGENTSTWRLFDDKNLSAGDNVELKEFVTLKHFANARLTKVIENSFKDLTDEDRQGHEVFNSDAEMYENYKMYYKTDVGPDTLVKIIWFDLTEKF